MRVLRCADLPHPGVHIEGADGEGTLGFQAAHRGDKSNAYRGDSQTSETRVTAAVRCQSRHEHESPNASSYGRLRSGST